jgi:hypothetical protein
MAMMKPVREEPLSSVIADGEEDCKNEGDCANAGSFGAI